MSVAIISSFLILFTYFPPSWNTPRVGSQNLGAVAPGWKTLVCREKIKGHTSVIPHGESTTGTK